MGATKVNTTTAGSYNYTLGSDQAAVVSAIAVSSAGCQVNSTNTLNVDRRTVDFSGISVNVASTAYCNGDDNVNFFTFVTAANKNDIEGSSNGWSYNLNSGGISQCGGNNNPKMLCMQNTSPGTYNTVFSVTKNACQATYNKTITVKPVPGATTLVANNYNLCADGSAVMTATTANYIGTYTYNWYKDGTATPTRSGSTSRTENYAAESGVLQAAWKVAAVDNGCTGTMSNEITIKNNQPTMNAAFTANTFSGNFKIGLSNMVNVNASSIVVKAKNLSTNAFASVSQSVSNDVYTITISGIGNINFEITVAFSDNQLGQCSNTITVGTINKNGSNYTVTSGSVQSAPAPQGTPQPMSLATTAPASDYDDEAERLYREYVAGLHNDEHLAFLAPTYTGIKDGVKLLIYSHSTEQVTVTVHTVMGSVVSTQSVYLNGGITEHWLQAYEKPQNVGMYYVVITYANGKRETLKGVIK
ncbi:hypothetical protein FACS189452_10080 [Bacteroidia bacterium]|nr:hypothetical protein FACS189452_10080 [Bacteroidia bacterium]